MTLQSDSQFQVALRSYQAGQLSHAKSLCDDMISRNRKDVNAIDLRAQVAMSYGHLDEAEKYFLKCAQLRPREPRPNIMLGELYLTQGRMRDALARYDKAIKLAPKDVLAIAGKAGVLEARGDRDKATGLLQPFLRAGTETPNMAAVQARIDLHHDRFDDVVALTARHLDRTDTGLGIRQLLHVLHGKALERLGRHDEAFAAFERSNTFMPGRFDGAFWTNHSDTLIEAFSADRMPSLPRATGDTSLPIFVLGMPRSGSTLVESILDTHPQVRGLGECADMQLLVNDLALSIGSSDPYPSCLEDLTSANIDDLSRRYLDPQRRRARGASRVVDKYLINYRHLGLLSLLFPQARVIHTRRDPVDTCLSCYVEVLNTVPHPYASSLEALGVVYRDYERLMTHWTTVLDIPILHVDYEGLVRDQETVTRRMLEFCDLPWNDACLRYYESKRIARTLSYDQVNKPIYGTSVGRAGRFQEQLRPLRESLGMAES